MQARRSATSCAAAAASNTANSARPARAATLLAPNVLSIPHWMRLGEGALRAAAPRLDWTLLLRRTFDVDVLACPTCKGRLRILAVMTEPEPVRALLARLDIATPPSPARARDPTTLLDADLVD